MKGKLFLFFSVILALCILIINGYKDENISIRPIYKTSTMRGLRITRKEEGRVGWELMAEDAVFSAEDGKVVIASLELSILDEPKLYLTGSSGIYYVEREIFVFDRPVEMSISDGKFNTDSLTWSSRSGLVTTDDRVKFKGKNFLIEGKGLSAKIKEKKMKILDNVKGTFYL